MNSSPCSRRLQGPRQLGLGKEARERIWWEPPTGRAIGSLGTAEITARPAKVPWVGKEGPVSPYCRGTDGANVTAGAGPGSPGNHHCQGAEAFAAEA